ncbi:hypothetical protein SEA_WEASELS2_165 [Rhodococcus phage Weasels2]|uniref:Uncharacterized protein n=1 Tax=Rhodococcus phage Weasels2 TaxID=1897437 RepID=A0A1I9SAD8_9CAUD|nr:hypothetical protein FDH04_gp250 [Rhodococcus phage Weasels2]AOZ63744.1 hypothetical protein SEA_WEASELS2_165 [Rhodococcus phage Weasels2]
MNAFWIDLNNEDSEFKTLFMKRIYNLQLFDEISNWFNYEGM